MVNVHQQAEQKEELWQILVRLAFRALLREMKEAQYRMGSRDYSKGSIYQALNLPDNVSDEPESGANSSEAVRKKRFTFRLPWMPEKSFGPKLLFILRVAQGIKTIEDLKKIVAPSSLTVFSGFNDLTEEEAASDAISFAVRLWRDKLLARSERSTEFKCKVAPSRSGSAASVASANKNFLSSVEKSIREGRAVAVLTKDTSNIDGTVRDLTDEVIITSGLNRAGLIELLRATHREAAMLSDQELFDALPPDGVLGRLSFTQVEAALRQPSWSMMLERLSRRTVMVPKSLGVTLEEVHGQPTAVRAFHGMIADLERWKRSEVEWSEVTSSAIMYGPPGNGKTLMASAVAGSAGIPFLSTSYSECQRAGHQGDMLKALNAAFEAAIAQAPSVLFIDEIDSFAERGKGDNADYMRGVVNGMLTEVSRAVEVPGLILLGATNHLNKVDPAVIRPGRFDLKIHVGNPTLAGIPGILMQHLGRYACETPDKGLFAEICADMVGMSGAEIAGKAREALGRARQSNRPFCLRDLMDVLPDTCSQRRKDALWRTAVHETGHLFVQFLTGGTVPQLVAIGNFGGAVAVQAETFHTLDTARARLRMLMGGRAAEALVFGAVSSGSGEGPDSDLAVATKLAILIESEWCLDSDVPVWSAADDILRNGIPSALTDRVKLHLANANGEAMDILAENQDALIKFATHLLKARELSGEKLEAALRHATERETCAAA